MLLNQQCTLKGDWPLDAIIGCSQVGLKETSLTLQHEAGIVLTHVFDLTREESSSLTCMRMTNQCLLSRTALSQRQSR